MLCNLNCLLGNWHFKTHSGFWSKVLVAERTYVTKPSPWLSWCYLLASQQIILSWFSHWSVSFLILVPFPAKGTQVISHLFPQKKMRMNTLRNITVFVLFSSMCFCDSALARSLRTFGRVFYSHLCLPKHFINNFGLHISDFKIRLRF